MSIGIMKNKYTVRSKPQEHVHVLMSHVICTATFQSKPEFAPKFDYGVALSKRHVCPTIQMNFNFIIQFKSVRKLVTIAAPS